MRVLGDGSQVLTGSLFITATDTNTDTMNTDTGAVQVLYDGVPTLTGSLFTTVADTTTDYVYWGDVSSFAFGQSVWASFAHDAYLFCAP